jgi:hypothetical protein
VLVVAMAGIFNPLQLINADLGLNAIGLLAMIVVARWRVLPSPP